MEGFKICPVCEAHCFPDMEVCFGCLHRFEDDERMAVVEELVPAERAVVSPYYDPEEGEGDAPLFEEMDEPEVASFPTETISGRGVEEAASDESFEVEVRVKIPSALVAMLRAS